MTKLLEIHIIQNHVPGNMNRDDLGAPKTCTFGGTQRLRVSSQCLKRAARTSESFETELGKSQLAVRTRKFEAWVHERLDQLVSEGEPDRTKKLDDLTKTACKIIKDNDEEGKKQPLIFLGKHELDELLNKLIKGEKTKNLNIKLPCVPVALFGRMTTSSAFETVDAAVCVAHALSTHKVVPEVDYWTAVGDRKEDRVTEEGEEHAGSEHLGERQFASATFYKYASIDLDQLVANLGGGDREGKDDEDNQVPEDQYQGAIDLTEKALRALLKGLVYSVPSGMKTSMGHSNPPSAVLIELKDRRVPTNYANAFVKPVQFNIETSNVVEDSVKVLEEFSECLHKSWCKPTESKWWRDSGGEDAGAFIETTVASAMKGRANG